MNTDVYMRDSLLVEPAAAGFVPLGQGAGRSTASTPTSTANQTIMQQ